MSLQGSINKWSDGIGYGAFIPTERAYYNVSTPTASARRPSSETTREYRRQNVTAGIDTHRSDISFGRTTESIRGGLEGDSRAREATKSLTSGEVGDFCWPAERARDGDVETILASVPSNVSRPPAADPSSVGGMSITTPVELSARSVKQHEQMAQAQVAAAAKQQQRRQQQCNSHNLTTSARSRCLSSSGGSSTWRSDATGSLSSVSRNSSRLSSSRSSFCSDHNDGNNSGRLTRRSASSAKPNQGVDIIGQQSSSRSLRERRLRPPLLGVGEPRHKREHQNLPLLPSPSSTSKLPQFNALDPAFDRHHKYDLMADERAARGGEITGRFGSVKGSSVVAASLLTSELSTPWSHVLRGQKW